jgi:hypothetical protein
MNILSINSFQCYDLRENEWVPFQTNKVLYFHDMVYKSEECEILIENSSIPYVINLINQRDGEDFYDDNSSLTYSKKGYYIIKSLEYYLVIDEKDWNAFIINIDMQNNSNSEPHDLLKVGI